MIILNINGQHTSVENQRWEMIWSDFLKKPKSYVIYKTQIKYKDSGRLNVER